MDFFNYKVDRKVDSPLAIKSLNKVQYRIKTQSNQIENDELFIDQKIRPKTSSIVDNRDVKIIKKHQSLNDNFRMIDNINEMLEKVKPMKDTDFKLDPFLDKVVSDDAD